MRVWRICKARHRATAYTGEGSRRYGGRWHHRGMEVVYTSDHIALAALEALVHMAPEDARMPYVKIPAEIPDGLPLDTVPVDALPPDWRSYPAPLVLRDLTVPWYRGRTAVGLAIPSAQIPEEFNVLLNPLHPDFQRITIGAPTPFVFDTRLLESR